MESDYILLLDSHSEILYIMTEYHPSTFSNCFSFNSYLSTGTDYASTLQEAEIPVIDRQTCEYLYNPLIAVAPELETIIKEDMICAGENYKRDSCKVRVYSKFLS